MYIELFLLDNLLMNLLILRLAEAMLSLRASMLRSMLAAFLGACLAAVGAGSVPALLSPPAKLATGLLFALALPFRGFKGYLRAVAALLFSTVTVGGAVLAAALMTGGAVSGGIIVSGLTVRAALIGAAAAAFLPRMIRRMLARRVRAELLVRLAFDIGGRTYECAALGDTGCTLTEPLSGLPVILLNGRRYADAAKLANVPVPIRTANGGSVIFALKPKRITLNGARVEAYIAFCDAEVPLVPIMLLSNGIPGGADICGKRNERKANIHAEADTEPACAAHLRSKRRKRSLLHKFGRIAPAAAVEGEGSGADGQTCLGRREREGSADRA